MIACGLCYQTGKFTCWRIGLLKRLQKELKVTQKSNFFLGYFGKTIVPSKDKRAFYFRSGHEIFKIDLKRGTSYSARRIIGFGNKGEHEITDFAIDKEMGICYALTKAGAVLGVSLSKKAKTQVNFIYGNEKRSGLRMFKGKKKEKCYNSCVLSRNGKFLLFSSAERIENTRYVRNTLYIYELSRGAEKPVYVTKNSVVTLWRGGEPLVKI
jgi:hypothetical protein